MQSQRVNLIYPRQDIGGGTASYTVHLYRALQLAGADVHLLRISDKPKRSRQFAGYTGVNVEWNTAEQLLAAVAAAPSLIVCHERENKVYATGLQAELMERGARIVLHEPTEAFQTRKMKPYEHLVDHSLIHRPICIRPTMREHFPDAVFIPHPYVRTFTNPQSGDVLRRPGAACSLARLTFTKRPGLILDANRLLNPEDRIVFHGWENRLATFVLKDKYPEFKQGGYTLPWEWGASVAKARGYTLMVDMTQIAMDGGGSQYTFMEAWDAGACVVLHRDWLTPTGEMQDGINCIAIDTAGDLALLIENIRYRPRAHLTRLVQRVADHGAHNSLRNHDPSTVGRRYMKELTQ